MQRAVRWVCLVVLIFNVPYCVSLLPGVRPTQGYVAMLDLWLNGAADASILVAVLLRAWSERKDRLAWLCIGTALTSAFAGSVLWHSRYRALPTGTGVTWSDVGWVAFYPLLFVGVVLLLRTRVRRTGAGVWWDGLVASLTAVALAVAYVPQANIAEAVDGIGLAWFYSISDVALVALGAAALTMLGKGRDVAWWLIGAAFVMFAVTDWAYAVHLAQGDYLVGGPLDLGWQLSRLALLAAALVSLRTQGSPVTPEDARMLAIPSACALAVLGVLFHATESPLPDTATLAALGAGVAVVVRTALTIREVRTLAEVRRQSLTDDLTGLANRRHFYEAMRRSVDEVAGRPCAVLLIDLDRFKEVNDSLGHHAGDELIGQVGRRLAAIVEDEGVLARLGGDEFAVFIEGGGRAQALRMAARIERAFWSPFQVDPARIIITGSIGIALKPLHASNAEELLQLADLAMYAAKAERRGTEVYDEARDGAGRHRLERITELRRALDDNQLVLHYQPQMNLRNDRVIGVEALVRWQHPVHGLLGPHTFLGLVESSGLMAKLTEWVVQEALEQCRSWRDGGLHVRVAVNVSPSVLVAPDFPFQVQRALARHAVPGHALVVEVTEELLMDHPERTITALFALRSLGVLVSVDDYGTGYSSLAYLKDLPVNELKLDRSFVGTMGSNGRSAIIVRSTIDLAHALGLQVVAEGVEDSATLEALVAAGCDLAQGHLFSKAVAVPDVVASIERLTPSPDPVP